MKVKIPPAWKNKNISPKIKDLPKSGVYQVESIPTLITDFYKSAGVLPLLSVKGSVFILLGSQWRKKKNVYCEFGGKREEFDESIQVKTRQFLPFSLFPIFLTSFCFKATALREFDEETNFEFKEHLHLLKEELSKQNKVIWNQQAKYVCFILPLPPSLLPPSLSTLSHPNTSTLLSSPFQLEEQKQKEQEEKKEQIPTQNSQKEETKKKKEKKQREGSQKGGTEKGAEKNNFVWVALKDLLDYVSSKTPSFHLKGFSNPNLYFLLPPSHTPSSCTPSPDIPSDIPSSHTPSNVPSPIAFSSFEKIELSQDSKESVENGGESIKGKGEPILEKGFEKLFGDMKIEEISNSKCSTNKNSKEEIKKDNKSSQQEEKVEQQKIEIFEGGALYHNLQVFDIFKMTLRCNGATNLLKNFIECSSLSSPPSSPKRNQN